MNTEQLVDQVLEGKNPGRLLTENIMEPQVGEVYHTDNEDVEVINATVDQIQVRGLQSNSILTFTDSEWYSWTRNWLDKKPVGESKTRTESFIDVTDLVNFFSRKGYDLPVSSAQELIDWQNEPEPITGEELEIFLTDVFDDYVGIEMATALIDNDFEVVEGRRGNPRRSRTEQIDRETLLSDWFGDNEAKLIEFLTAYDSQDYQRMADILIAEWGCVEGDQWITLFQDLLGNTMRPPNVVLRPC